jgi:hypothetical protein
MNNIVCNTSVNTEKNTVPIIRRHTKESRSSGTAIDTLYRTEIDIFADGDIGIRQTIFHLAEEFRFKISESYILLSAFDDIDILEVLDTEVDVILNQ